MILARLRFMISSAGSPFRMMVTDRIGLATKPTLTTRCPAVSTASFPVQFSRNVTYHLNYLNPFTSREPPKPVAKKVLLLGPGEPIRCKVHMQPSDLWMPGTSLHRREALLHIQKYGLLNKLTSYAPLRIHEISDHIMTRYAHDPDLPPLALGLTYLYEGDEFIQKLFTANEEMRPPLSLISFARNHSAVSDYDFMKKKRYIIPFPASVNFLNRIKVGYRSTRGGVLSAMLKTIYDGRKIHFNLDGLNVDHLNFCPNRGHFQSRLGYNIADDFDRDFVSANIPFTFFELMNILGNVALYYNTEFYEHSGAKPMSLEERIAKGWGLQHGFRFPGQHLMMSYISSQQQISEIMEYYAFAYNYWLRTGSRSATVPWVPDFKPDMPDPEPDPSCTTEERDPPSGMA